MTFSKNWLEEAKNLCDEFGPEDGIDPRVIARKTHRNTKGHKSERLSKEAWHTLSMVFAGELSDSIFQDLEVVDVTASGDSQYLIVSLASLDTCLDIDEAEILEKCRAVQGYLRSAIASTVKRKRVPALKFEFVQATSVVNKNANL